MSSRDLDDLNDDTRFLALAFSDACHREGVDVLIYCTLRSNDEQAKLYAKGRTEPGKIVTNARPGESAHNPDLSGKSSAFDCCPLLHGKPVWGSSTKEDAALWSKMGSIGESVGLVWSGRWQGKLREMAHFQNPTWRKPE